MAFAKRANLAAIVRMIAVARVVTVRAPLEKRATTVPPIAAHVAAMALAKRAKIVNRARMIVALVVATELAMLVNLAAIARVIVRVAEMESARAEKTATIALPIANQLAAMAFVNAARRVRAARMIAAERAAIRHVVMANAGPNAVKIRVRAQMIAASGAVATCNARPGKIATIAPRIVNRSAATGFANAAKAEIVPTTATSKSVETVSVGPVNRRAIAPRIVKVRAA